MIWSRSRFEEGGQSTIPASTKKKGWEGGPSLRRKNEKIGSPVNLQYQNRVNASIRRIMYFADRKLVFFQPGT
jgi:hypothetical protein